MTQDVRSFETIIYDMAGPEIARITLNRPDALNAFTGVMAVELTEVLRQAANNPAVKCLLLTGAGRAFGAGQDLRANPESLNDLQNWLATNYRPMLLALENLNKPTIAMVNGVAAGASFALTLACDFRVASTKARFVPAFGKIALVPDCGMTYYLPRLIGLSRSLELLGTGRVLNGEEAMEWGLVNRVSPPEQLEETTLIFANQLTQAAPLAYSLTRQLFHGTANLDLQSALKLEEEAQGKAGASQDFQEGLAAFEEKRTPHFTGQ